MGAVDRLTNEVAVHKRSVDADVMDLGDRCNDRFDNDAHAIKELDEATQGCMQVTSELEDSFATLVTKESYWDVMDKRK